jgi:Arc/MetJ-type ribon-helix-helix transcriptional regulator
MRSVRLEPELDAQLQEAARATGRPVSEIIREAIRKWCDDWRGDRLDRRLSDVIGSARSGGGDSRRTGRDFAEALDEEDRRKRSGAG